MLTVNDHVKFYTVKTVVNQSGKLYMLKYSLKVLGGEPFTVNCFTSLYKVNPLQQITLRKVFSWLIVNYCVKFW